MRIKGEYEGARKEREGVEGKWEDKRQELLVNLMSQFVPITVIVADVIRGPDTMQISKSFQVSFLHLMQSDTWIVNC